MTAKPIGSSQKVDLEQSSRASKPRGVGRVFARSTPKRAMTPSERLTFFDEIRSRSVVTKVDSTDVIRRDRDDR